MSDGGTTQHRLPSSCRVHNISLIFSAHNKTPKSRLILHGRRPGPRAPRGGARYGMLPSHHDSGQAAAAGPLAHRLNRRRGQEARPSLQLLRRAANLTETRPGQWPGESTGDRAAAIQVNRTSGAAGPGS